MSKLGAKILKRLNPLFKKQIHPFNLQQAGEKTYAEWQYEKGENTIRFYLERYTAEEMFGGKDVLDIGCGAGGKSLYYASLGARVTGLDVVASYEAESKALCEKLGRAWGSDFTFVLGDAGALPFADRSFDTVIMNDAFEHVNRPEAALREALRVLRPGGRVYVNFPPYYHPFGAHLSDAVNIPWVHIFFTDDSLIRAYKDLVAPLPDGAERIAFRISRSETGREYFSYINKMTIRRAKRILRSLGVTPVYRSETPLRRFLKPLCFIPGVKGMFVKMVCFVLEKQDSADPAVRAD